MIPLPPKRDKNRYPCPVCNQTSCYKHCNNCGRDIFFKKNDWGKWSCYEELTGTLHRCMQGGTKSGKYLDVNNKRDEQKKQEDNKYRNIGSMMEKSIIYEKDNKILVVEKMRMQKRLRGADTSGLGYVERYFRDLDPEIKKKYIEEVRRWSQ